MNNLRWKYIDEYTANGIDTVAICPAIIEPELYARVQERLAEHLQKHRHFNSSHSYILTGKVIFAECEKPMSGTCGRSHTGQYHYYYKCGCHKFPVGKLEETVIRAITQYLTADNCKKIANAVYQLYQKERKENPELQYTTSGQRCRSRFKRAVIRYHTKCHSRTGKP